MPLTAPLKLRSPVAKPLHTASLPGTITVGVGFTVSVKLCVKPGQPFAEGNTVISAVTGDVPLLVTVNDGILPAPVDARPIVALSLIQV